MSRFGSYEVNDKFNTLVSPKFKVSSHHVYKHVIGMFMCLSKMFMCKFVDS
ncbi:hypothetical protein Hanom_Chr16g01419141 [Helianthus anomalus]